MLDLEAIKARCEAASLEPWEASGPYGKYITSRGISIVKTEDPANAAFIAAARTDIPALIAEVEHQRRQIEALKAEVANGIVDERRACAALAELYAQACPLCHKGAAAIRARGDNA